MNRYRILGALLLAAHFATACDRARPPRERDTGGAHAASVQRKTLPRDVRLACDSAAAMAARAGARRVRLVTDTAEATYGLACAVIVDSLRDSAGVGSALFQKGFPGGRWRLNLFETSDPEGEYAVWQPTIFCDVEVRHELSRNADRARSGVMLGFDILCVPQTPNDTPRVVQSSRND